jgi:hypothetical protein
MRRYIMLTHFIIITGDCSSSRSSTDLEAGGLQKRPASKVWKMPMTQEVHQDLLRALRVRSKENLLANVSLNKEQLDQSADTSETTPADEHSAG